MRSVRVELLGVENVWSWFMELHPNGSVRYQHAN
jgi:hypothetical protein